MNREVPPYAGLLAEIRAGLTGDPKLDVPFLNSQAMRYREEPWAAPFLREIGRLVFDLLPARFRDEAAEANQAGMAGFEDLRRRAWEHLQGGDLDEAFQEAQELLVAVQTFGTSDLDATFFDYEDPLEEEFHRAQPGRPETARRSPLSHQPALILLSQVQLARGDEAGALESLDRAIRRGPAQVLPRFLRLNVLKQRGEVDLALQEGLEVLSLCHGPLELAQGFRHLGRCFAERDQWEPAAAALLVSLHHEWNRLALQELGQVVERSGRMDLEGCARRACTLLEQQGVRPAPDPQWATAARALRERCLASGDREQADWCSGTLVALEAPVDLEAVVRRIRSERMTAAPDEADAGPAWTYLRSLQQNLLGWVSRVPLEEGRLALAREVEDAKASGRPPFWIDEAAQLSAKEWDQSLLFGQPILAEMGTRLLRQAEWLDLQVGPVGAWGVLPAPGLVARVLVAPTGERVPVVSSGWLLFAHLMAKVTASCLPVHSHEGEEKLSFQEELVEAHLRTDRSVGQRFTELMQATARGDAGMAPRWVLGGPAGPLGSLFCESAELFLVAEQLALAGVAEVRDDRVGGVSVSRVAPAREEQVRASVVALQLAAAGQAERGLGFPLCATGIVTCLFGAALVEGLEHPPTPERQGFLTAGYRLQILLEVLRKKAPQALELAETLMQSLRLLWKTHEQELRAAAPRPS